MDHSRTKRRSILSRASSALAIVLSLIAAALVPAPAAAADLSKFTPGYIISDEVFFNADTMSVAQIQTFLDAQVPRCATGATCLKNWRGPSQERAANPMCNAMAGSASESAASLIYRVSKACGINPQVMLVMMQKEQGLVRSTNPSAYAFNAAMGYDCPDTTGCSANGLGFATQVYGGAHSFKRYANPPGTSNFFTWYQPGRTWNILYNPNTACGSAPVFIQNQATANLYYYTPYQPNAAALRAGYGEGDGCSAYGNRNFFNYFSDWFGSPVNAVDVAVAARYSSLGGANSVLGGAAAGGACGLKDNGCWRNYANGAIYASAKNPPRYVLSGPVRDRWSALGYEQDRAGALGYPRTDTVRGLRSGGSWQDFEAGGIYSWTAGTFVMRNGPVRDRWSAQNYEHGALGYPSNDTVTTLRDGGSFQAFEGGSIYASARGAHIVPRGPIATRWAQLGYEQARPGALGYPVGGAATGLESQGSWQDFESGAIYSYSKGTFVVRNGAIRQAWAAQDYEHGALGYPTEDTVTGLRAGGSRQTFEGGVVYASAAGGFALSDAEIRRSWTSAGAESGPLGYPVSPVRTEQGATWQFFENGALVRQGTTLTQLSAPVAKRLSVAAARTALGAPVGAEKATASTQYRAQQFQRGMVYVTGTSAYIVTEPQLAAWGGTPAKAGPLGYPTGDVASAARGATWQSFQNGGLYRIDGVMRRVTGTVFATWRGQGYEHGVLGFPTADAVTGLRDGGSFQAFEGGAVYVSASGTFALPNGAIRDRWSALGFEHAVASSLGYPTGAQGPAARGGSWQRFEDGAIYLWSGRTTVVRSPILERWAAQDYEHGGLRFPVGDTVTGLRDSGSFQRFEGGVIYSSPKSGTRAIPNGAILNTWVAQNYEHGSLGYPTGEYTPTSTGGTQAFQGGTLEWRASDGAVIRR